MVTADVWEVVGGGAAGGLIVREGQSTSSPEFPGRLARGAVIRSVELQDRRLLYELICGQGPARGWVSTALKGKQLLVKRTEELSVEHAATGPPQLCEEERQEIEAELHTPTALQLYVERFGRASAADGDSLTSRATTESATIKWKATAAEPAPVAASSIAAWAQGDSVEDADAAPARMYMPAAQKPMRNGRFCTHCGLPLGEHRYSNEDGEDGGFLHGECMALYILQAAKKEDALRRDKELVSKLATRKEYSLGWDVHQVPRNRAPLAKLNSDVDPQSMCCLVLDQRSGSVAVGSTFEPGASVNLEYLSLSLQARHRDGCEPLFSLDPTSSFPDPKELQERTLAKRFQPEWLAGTSVGEVMFQADYYLKELCMGEYEQPVVGMKSCFDFITGREYQREWGARVWYIVRHADVLLSEDGVLLPELTMGVEARQTKSIEGGSEDVPITRPDHPMVKYASGFTRNFDLIAERRSVLYHLRELAKATVLAKYLLESGAVLESSWFGLCGEAAAACSLEIPPLWSVRHDSQIKLVSGQIEQVNNGVPIQAHGIYGGVEFGLDRFSFGPRPGASLQGSSSYGARGPMQSVSAALSMATSSTGGLRRPPRAAVRASISMRSGGVPRGIAFGLDKFSLSTRGAGLRGPQRFAAAGQRAAASLSAGTTGEGQGLRAVATRGVDLDLGTFDLARPTQVHGRLLCRQSYPKAEAPLAKGFWAALEEPHDGRPAFFSSKDAKLLKEVFNPRLCDRRNEGGSFVPPATSSEYVEKLRRLVRQEKDLREERKQLFLGKSFGEEGLTMRFPQSWHEVVKICRAPHGKLPSARLADGLLALPVSAAEPEQLAKALQTQPTFDNSTEEGLRFRIYETGTVQARTTQDPDGEEIVGAVFMRSSHPRATRKGNGMRAIDDHEKLVKVTLYVEAAEHAPFHNFVVMETESGEVVLTERLRDGTVTWEENPQALEMRSSRAKALHSARCADSEATVASMEKLRARMGRGSIVGGTPFSESKHYAEDVFDALQAGFTGCTC